MTKSTKRVNLFLERTYWQAIRREAETLGLSVAAYCRMAVGEKLRAERLKAKGPGPG